MYVADGTGSDRRHRRQVSAGRWITPGILPFTLRASLRLFTTFQEHMLSAALRAAARRVSDRDVANQIAPGDFVSLHAGVACKAHEREKLERLCRYITRPAVSTERLSFTTQGNIRYRLVAPAHSALATFVHPCTAKTPYRDGTTDVVFGPLDFMGEHCGGAVKVIASIEDPAVIKKILDQRRAEPATPVFRPFAREPPQMALPGLKEPG